VAKRIEEIDPILELSTEQQGGAPDEIDKDR
jgi:hypothetical protein